ncbi:MAG TPA: 30S ribosomal protein S17 [Candidatus Paceibacterota bacterium]|nr:30S ribosomal protein S17 [Candidatus Paceibacterota bacterium]HQB57235.1 30S ribosomal protein S17 [Candidatus Paceibacterota bacterium]
MNDQIVIKHKKKIDGVVVSDKMDKTVVVNAQRFVKHKKYGKYYKIDKKFKAHDENNEYKVGDKVTIEETRPISKDKNFKVLKKR